MAEKGGVVVNGKEVTPAKKVKLFQEKPAMEIQKMIRRKREEQERERKSSSNKG